MLKLIKSNGVDKKTTQISGMRFGENTVYRNKIRVREGYIASTNIAFSFSGFEKYQSVWLELSKVSQVSIENVSYDYAERIEIQNETRKLALLAAKEKAQSMANTLGVETGNVVSISENTNTFSDVASNALMSESRSRGAGSQSVSLGTIPVEVKV